MAISLGDFNSTASSAINGVNSSLNTLTRSTSSLSSNFSIPTDAVSRNISAASGLPSISLGGASIGNLANQFLGDQSGAAKLIGQGTAAFGAINKLSGSLGGMFGNTSGNPLSISSLIAGKLSASGLGSFASSIEGLSSIGQRVAGSVSAFNKVTVSNRTNQEVRGAVGGSFDTARAYTESFKPDTNGIMAALEGTGDKNPNIQTNSSGRIENPLRQFNHHNYIITLGVLDKDQSNSPSSYRSEGQNFKKVLIRSGGGAYENRIRTADEGNENAEYFIDDIEIAAVIAPNPNTGTALGTNVTFKIIEPYSMGKLLEALEVGAMEAGYAQYTQMPFCLKIEFLGWDERGEKPITPAKPAYIPIRITKMDFAVTQQGSVYDCKAVPFNEGALSDVVNKTRIAISSQGTYVHEILENAKDSVTDAINSQIENLENRRIIKGYDRYLICFPKNRDDLQKAIQAAQVESAALATETSPDVQLQARQGTSTTASPNDPNAQIPVISPNAPNQYKFLKAWASNTANMNNFGLSTLITDSRDGGNQAQTRPAEGVTPTGGNAQPGPTTQPAEKARKFNFVEGCKVTDIIEEVLKSSTYANENTTREPANGMTEYFRLETMVFLERDSGPIEAEIGRPRKTYVYAVHPFYTHEARHLPSDQAPRSIDQLKALSKKEYNYYYTGKNEDVLNFDIKFNTAFFMSIRADAGQNSSTGTGQSVAATGAPPSTRVTPTGDRPNPAPGEPQGGSELQAAGSRPQNGGTRVGTAQAKTKRAIADEYYDRLINSPVDMITAEMEIWGDPYYLPSDIGNNSSPPGAPSVTGDGTMSFMRDEVYVLINFRSPLDYYISKPIMDFPAAVPAFSGVYQVISVTNTFSQAQFKNKIKMIRIRNQSTPPTTGNRAGVLQEGGTRENITSTDPAANLPDNPEAQPIRPPTVSVTESLSKVLNKDTATGSLASYSQERLTTGTVSAATDTIVTNPSSSIQEAFKDNAAALSSLPIDTASRLGITANLTTSVFPLKLPAGSTDLAALNAQVSSLVTGANKLKAQGLNGPLGVSLPNFGSTSSLLSGVSGTASSLAAQASVLTGGLSRIQSSVNSATSGVSTQARAIGIRPPTGLG